MKFAELVQSPTTPSLQMSSEGRCIKLTASLFIALLVTSGLCGVLALITWRIAILEQNEATPTLSLTQEEFSLDEPEAPSNKQFRSLARPLSPQRSSIVVSETMIEPESEAHLSPPLTAQAIPSNDVSWEPIDDTNPFKKTQKATPQKKSSKVAKKQAKKRLQDQQQQQALLAKKIVRSASVISKVSPHYPKKARRKKQEGRVVISVTISTSGRITAAQIAQSSGFASLDTSALKAAQQYRFSPAVNGLGKTVATKKRIPFVFRLTS